MSGGTPGCSPAPTTPCSPATARPSTRGASWRARGSGYARRVSTPTGAIRPGRSTRRRSSGAARLAVAPGAPRAAGRADRVAEDARHVMVVTDADGVLLWREGSTRVRHRADALGFTEGAALDRGRRRHQRDRHRAGRGTRRCRSSPPSTSCRPPRLELHRLPRCTTRAPASCSASSTSAGPRDRAPDDRRARRHGREARRGAACGATTSSARRAAPVGRPCSRPAPARGCSSTTTAGSRHPPACRTWTGSRRRPPTVRWPCTGWGCACPSRSRVAGCCARAGPAARCG